MNKPLSVLVACPLPRYVLDEINAKFSVEYSPEGLPKTLSAPQAQRFDAIIVSVGEKLSASVIEALPLSVSAIATYSVGVDHIDLGAARRRGLAVFNTPGVLADSVADAALFLLLGAARRGTEAINLLRSRAWQGWSATALNGVELAGKNLGLLGYGDIGQRIARRCRAFGMHIHYSKRNEGCDPDAIFHADPADVLRLADFIVLAWPSTSDTRGYINHDRLRLVKQEAIIVNIGRGDLVIDEDLINALKTKRVRAAGLDVFSGEPNIDPRYYDLPNVFMTPHIASSTVESRTQMGRTLICALTAWAAGVAPSNQIHSMR